MKAAFLVSKNNIEIKDIDDIDNVPENYIKIRIKSVGICGSDVHYYNYGRIGNFVLEKPMIIGHETSGIAVSDGKNIKKGDVVAVEPGIPCGKCNYCKSGRYNLCNDMKFFATPPIDGSIREYIVHPESFVYKADGLTTEEASLAEPMSVGIYATRKAGIKDKVLIVGAGSVGILTGFAAESIGSDVTIVDIDNRSIENAKKCGFNAFKNSEINGKFDAVFECSGNAIDYALERTEKGGDLFLIGMNSENAINPLYISINEITIHGIFRYTNTFETAIKLIKKYKERLKPFLENNISMYELPDYMKNENYKGKLKTIVEL